MSFVSVTHVLSPITGSEGSVCNRFPVHAGNLYMLQYIQVHSTTSAANSHFGDFNDGISCVLKITTGESKENPMMTKSLIWDHGGAHQRQL